MEIACTIAEFRNNIRELGVGYIKDLKGRRIYDIEIPDGIAGIYRVIAISQDLP